jgi:hypothetical protein
MVVHQGRTCTVVDVSFVSTGGFSLDQFGACRRATLSNESGLGRLQEESLTGTYSTYILPAVRLQRTLAYQQAHRASAHGVLEDSGEFGIAVRGTRLRTQKTQSAKSVPGERGMRVCGLRWRNDVCRGGEETHT